MRLGPLDRRVTVQRETVTSTDDLNNPVTAWSDLFDAWASVRFDFEDENVAAQQRYAERVVTFTIRWQSDVKTTDRVLFESDPFNILGIRELGRKDGLELKAKSAK
jgi:SPP1 family predicted phage head-tail adaptor